ncbi:MAG: AbrB/MazE/SpoVT family DNA-binding domain-containing protein [Armatimonadota bacterium]
MAETRSFEDFFFGAVRIGERGQVSLPAEARKRAGMEPGDRLLAFLHPWGAGILLMKVDQVNVWYETVRQMLKVMDEMDLHELEMPPAEGS